MKRAGVLPERRGFKSVCDGSGRTSAVKADIRNPLRYSVKADIRNPLRYLLITE